MGAEREFPWEAVEAGERTLRHREAVEAQQISGQAVAGEIVRVVEKAGQVIEMEEMKD